MDELRPSCPPGSRRGLALLDFARKPRHLDHVPLGPDRVEFLEAAEALPHEMGCLYLRSLELLSPTQDFDRCPGGHHSRRLEPSGLWAKVWKRTLSEHCGESAAPHAHMPASFLDPLSQRANRSSCVSILETTRDSHPLGFRIRRADARSDLSTGDRSRQQKRNLRVPREYSTESCSRSVTDPR
jgi:hypothetical protein